MDYYRFDTERRSVPYGARAGCRITPKQDVAQSVLDIGRPRILPATLAVLFGLKLKNAAFIVRWTSHMVTFSVKQDKGALNEICKCILF